MLESTDLSTPLLADACVRCGPPIRESGQPWPGSRSLGASGRCDTTAA